MTEHFKGLQIGSLNDDGVFEPGQPVVQRLTSKTFVVMRHYVATWQGGRIKVDRGFECDQASIPRLFRVIIPKGGLHDGPSIIHDWCYRNNWRSRWESDQLFLSGMKVAGTWWLRRTVIYLAVRSFGWVFWATAKLRNGDTAANNE